MEVKKDIIDIVCQTHTEVKEKIAFLKDLLVVLDKNSVWEDTKDILGFFNKNLVNHFKSEEILISVLKRNVELQPNEIEIVNEILEEHKIILEKVSKLNKLAKKFNSQDKELREEFIEICHDIIDVFLTHADKEDKMFFPFVRQKINKKQFKEIEKRILE